MTGQITTPSGVSNAATPPNRGVPQNQYQSSRGLCSLSYEGHTLNFRTNPNSVQWDYSLVTHIQQTYGGRIVQILGVKMDNLVVKVDCGGGGWPYAMQVVNFMRDMMVAQRNGKAGTFTYTTRNWKLSVLALNVPYGDEVTATVRELELEFKIQEDNTGVLSKASLVDALKIFSDGVGWDQSVYNNFVLAEGQQVNNQDNGSFIGGAITPTTALAPVLTAANAASSIFGSSI